MYCKKVFTHIILTWIFSTQLPLTHVKKEKGLLFLCKSSQKSMFRLT